MPKVIHKLISTYLRSIADSIDAGTCELSEEEASDIMSAIAHKAISKEEACTYLNMCRATFDNLVRIGKIPQGRKRKGFKELVWYEDELQHLILNK